MDRPEHFFNFADGGAGMRRDLADGVFTQIFVGDQAMFSVVSFEPDCRGSMHSHDEEQWGIVLEGSGIRIQDGAEVPVSVGDFWCTPSGIEHGFIAGLDGARVVDVFAPPREAYRSAGEGFGV